MPGEIDNLQIKIAADSQSASENVLALARSLESLSAAALNATNPLTAFSKALNGLKTANTSGVKQSADDLSKAFAQINKIGTIDNSVQLLDSVENLKEAMSGLSNLSKGAKDLKIGKSFANNIEALSNALPKLSNAGNVDDAVTVLDSVENLEQATAGLRNISENIRSLKIGTSFDKNLEQLSLAMAHLNEIGDTSAFGGGVEAISHAIERLNNIEVGQGFINLVQASTQWADAISKMNDIKLGVNFSEGIARVARAAEILNDVDFGGFKRMNDALASLPDNVRISFGASSTEVQELTEHLVNLNNTVQSIQTNMPQRRQRNTDTIGTADNSTAVDRPDYSWSNDEVKGTLERASAFNKELAEIKKVIAAYDTMGEEVPDSVIKAAESLGVFDSAMDETSGKAYSLRDTLKDASRAVATGAFKALGTELKLVMSPLTAIGSKFKAAAAKAGQFVSSIKRIAMYRAIRSILKAITEGFEEGRKNLYYYSQAVGTDFAPSMDKAATAALYLKNSIGAATAPLTNYLVPMIDKAVDHIVELINKFNELTAVLTGASTWTKAIKYPTTWQESLDDANKSAKKLKSTMLGFDELNVIEIAEPASKKSGFDADDYIKMFEEVKTDMSVSSKIPELLMPVKLAWDSQGDNTLKTIKDTWNEILALIGAVGESVRKVWTNGTGQKSLELILQIVQNIVGTFGELAKGIRKAWEENETGTRIIQATWNVANNLLTVFRDIWGSLREWASGLDWSPLLNAIAGLGEALDRLTDPDGALAKIAKGAVDKLLLPLGTWLIEKGLPSAVNLLAVSFDTLGATLELLEPALSAVADALGKITGFTFSNITGLVDGFTGIIGTFFGKDVSNEVVKSVQDSADNLIETFGGDDSFYGKLSKEIDKVGSHGMYDFLNETMPSVGDKIAQWFYGDESGHQFSKDAYTGQQLGNQIYEWLHPDIEDNGIIPEQNVASFNKSVATISAGYSKIGDSASEAYETTADTMSVTNMTSGVSSFKESYKTMLDDWESGVTSMSHGWNDFTYSIKEEWKMFNDNWASGMTSMSNGWNRFTDGIKEKWQTFKDDWASGMTDLARSASETWEGIKTFFSDGWDAIKGGIAQFGEDWSNGWNGIKDAVSGMWENAKSDFESGWNTISDGIEGFKKSFSSGMDLIKKTAKNAWSAVSATLSSKWDDFKKFVKDYDKNWADGFGSIKTTVSDAWDTIKEKIGNNGAWGSLKQSVTEYAGNWFDKLNQIRSNVKYTFDKIYSNIVNSKVGQAISDIASNIKETIGGIWGDETSGIKGTFKKISDGLSDFIRNLFDENHLGKIGNDLRNTLNSVIGVFETAVNYIIEGLNFFIDKINGVFDVHIKIPNIPGVPHAGEEWEGFNLKGIPEFSFPKFANGGFPDKGSLFLANEPGNPEMVGKIGGHTAVANNDQIVQAVSTGVYNAVMAAMVQTRQSGENGSKQELHVYLDRKELTAEIEEQQRDNGFSIMSGAVFA